MSTQTPIYRKALKEEHDAIAAIMDACLYGGDRKSVPHVLVDSDLDRQAADDAISAEIDQIGGKDSAELVKQCMQVAANKAEEQEDQRVRRDTRIMRMNHKRLMLGCLQTLYWRRHDLEVSLGI